MIRLLPETPGINERSGNELNLSHSSSSASILVPHLTKNQPAPSSNSINTNVNGRTLTFNPQSPEPTSRGFSGLSLSGIEGFINYNNNIQPNMKIIKGGHPSSQVLNLSHHREQNTMVHNKENSNGSAYNNYLCSNNDTIHKNYLTPPANRSLVGGEALTPISQQNISQNSSCAGNLLLEKPDRTMIFKDMVYLQDLLNNEREKNEALSNRLQSVQNELTDLVIERNSIKKKGEALQNEVERLKEQLSMNSNNTNSNAQARSANESNFKMAYEALQREKEQIEKEAKELNLKFNEEFDKKQKEISNLRTIVDAYQSNFSKKDEGALQENQRLTKELDLMKGILKDYKDLEASCEDLIKENERMNMILLKKNQEIDELKEKQTKISILNLSSNTSGYSANNSFLPAELERKITDLIEENCGLNECIKLLRVENQGLIKESSLLKDQTKKLLDLNEKINEIVEEHDRSIRALIKRNCELEQELSNQKKLAKQAYSALEAKFKEQQIDVKSKAEKLTQLENDLKKKNQNTNEEVSEEVVRDLKKKLVSVIEENDKLNLVLMGKLEEVEMIKKVEAKLELLIKENQSLRTDIINKNYEVEYWQKRVVDNQL